MNLLAGWLQAWARRDRSIRVLFGNDEPFLSPSIRLLLRRAAKGRPVTLIEFQDLADLAADARQYEFEPFAMGRRRLSGAYCKHRGGFYQTAGRSPEYLREVSVEVTKPGKRTLMKRFAVNYLPKHYIN
jgi:hypothetical protein